MKVHLCIVLVTIWSSLALAGGMEGGGGNAVVCSDGSVQLYDLFEAAYPFFGGANIVRTSAPTDSQIATAIRKLQQVSVVAGYNLNDYLSLVKSRIIWVPSGTMPPSNDFGPSRPVIVPNGCSLQGIAYYDANNRLFISQTLFNAMSPTDQAGLMLHEAAYYFTRTNRLDFSNPALPTSDQIRQLIGEMFAQNLSIPVVDADQLLYYSQPSQDNWFDGPWNCSLTNDCPTGSNWGANGSGIIETLKVGGQVVVHYGGSSTATMQNAVNCYSSASQLIWTVDLLPNKVTDVDISQCRYATTKLGSEGDYLTVDGGAAQQIYQRTLIVGHP